METEQWNIGMMEWWNNEKPKKQDFKKGLIISSFDLFFLSVFQCSSIPLFQNSRAF